MDFEWVNQHLSLKDPRLPWWTVQFHLLIQKLQHFLDQRHLFRPAMGMSNLKYAVGQRSPSIDIQEYMRVVIHAVETIGQELLVLRTPPSVVGKFLLR